MQTRDLTLDYAKAVCIILMVIGHCCYIGHISLFIYTFHMPCFFFISGMLLSDSSVENLKEGVIHKLKSYYLPFVKWSIVFILLHNLFTYVGFQTGYYDVKTTAIKLAKVFMLKQSEPTLHQFWFLSTLTISSLLAVSITHILKKKNVLNDKILTVCIAMSVLLSVLLSFVEINSTVTMLRISFFALSFYLSGFLFKKKDFMSSPLIDKWLPLYIVGAISPLFIKLEFFYTREYSIILYYVVAMCGVLATLSLSRKLLTIRCFNIFSYIGKNTLYVLIFHYVAFKIVSFLYIVLSGEDYSLLANNVIYTNELWLSVLYACAGVVIPLSGAILYQRMPRLLRR